MKLQPLDLVHVSLRRAAGEVAVGRLAADGGRVYFEFAEAFRALRLDISPFALPLKPGVQEEKTRVFDGLFGVFHDSLPDGWGRLLLDRDVERHGIRPGQLTPLHRLSYVGARGMGALCYRPEAKRDASDDDEAAIDLDQLARQSTRVLSGIASDVLSELLKLGGSSGGARPKVLIGFRPADGHLVAPGIDGDLPDDHQPYLVKFRARDDGKDASLVEWAYAELARRAGLVVMDTHLFGSNADKHWFGTRRFDRTVHGGRVHVHSFGGLVHGDHRVPGSLDYADLLKATRALTKDQREVDAAFRHMAFNVLAHNRDDHAKNFAFLMDDDGAWRKSPAFDLTFSDGPGGEHWMGVAREGRAPALAHMLAVAKAGGIAERRARTVIDEVRSAVADWDSIARGAGVKNKTRVTIARAMAAATAAIAP